MSLPIIRSGLALAAIPALAFAAPAAQAATFDGPAVLSWSQESAAHGRDRDRDYRRDGYRGYGDSRYGRYDRYDRYDRNDYRGDRVHRNTRVWRGDNGRYYCKKDDGTTGLLIGGAVGGLIGNEVARDRTLGAILGAAGGALLGREIDRGNTRCR